MGLSIILIVILVIVLYVITTHNEYFADFTTLPVDFQKKIFNKPIIWSYWELKPGDISPPAYINLCFKTFYYNCATKFDVKILNEKTVYDYIPELRNDLNHLNIAAKSDYIRIALLYFYGGIWLDADTIVMTDLKQITDKLDQAWDFVGFGCTGNKCMYDGYPRPSNGAMASQKGSILMKNTLLELDKKLDEYYSQDTTIREKLGYFDLGKIILWKEIDNLIKLQNYNYYHFPSYADGSRDVDGNWIAPYLIFEKNINLMDHSRLIIVFLANSIYCGNDTKYNWFCKLSEEDILNGPYFVSSLFRKSLDYKI